MELCGYKQATAHAHGQPHCVCLCLNFEHTKNSNPSKQKFPQRRKSNSNLLINSQNPRNHSNIFSGAWYSVTFQLLREITVDGDCARRIVAIIHHETCRRAIEAFCTNTCASIHRSVHGQLVNGLHRLREKKTSSPLMDGGPTHECGERRAVGVAWCCTRAHVCVCVCVLG